MPLPASYYTILETAECLPRTTTFETAECLPRGTTAGADACLPHRPAVVGFMGCGWVLAQGVVVLALERPEVSGLSVTRTCAIKNRWEMLRKTSRDMLIEE